MGKKKNILCVLRVCGEKIILLIRHRDYENEHLDTGQSAKSCQNSNTAFPTSITVLF